MQNAWTRFVQSVTDVKKTVEFYVNTLGWESPWYFGDPPDFAGVYGFSEMEFRLACENVNVCGYPLHVTATDLETLFAKHRDNGVTFVRPLESQTWDEFGYVIEDLNGYHVRFTERLPDRPHEAANLVVPDLEVALTYYQEVLGFSDVSYWGEPPEYARLESPTRIEFWQNAVLSATLPQHMISVYGDGVDSS